MNRFLAYLLHRVGFAVVAAYAVVTLVFLFLALTPDPNLASVMYNAQHSGGNASEAVLEAKRTYLRTRGLDRPLSVRYLDWLWSVTTLQWGMSWNLEQPVLDLLAGSGRRTLRYVVPAVAVSTVGGTLVALFSAGNRNSWPDRLVSLSAYVGLGLPNFWLAALVVVYLLELTFEPSSPMAPRFLGASYEGYLWPAAVLTTTLLASQIHYARAEVHEHLNAHFVEVLRAKGVGWLGVARHVLRNAVLPLLSLFVSDLLTVLMFHVFVIEAVFDIPGVGLLTLFAARTRDVPLIMGVTMLLVFVGILGNLLQDTLYYRLDPRVRIGGEE